MDNAKLLSIVVLIIAIGHAQSLRAQDEGLEEETYHMAMLYGFGLDYPFMTELSRTIETEGYAAFNPLTTFSHSFSFFLQRDRFVSGVDSFVISNTTASDSGGAIKKLKLRVKYVFYDLGVSLVSSQKARLYLLLGLGANKSIFYLYDSNVPSFPMLLSGPTGSALLSALNFSAKLSLGILGFSGPGSSAGSAPRLTLGVFAHYFIVPFSMKWKVFGDPTVAGVPQVLHHAFAVNLSIGIGG